MKRAIVGAVVLCVMGWAGRSSWGVEEEYARNADAFLRAGFAGKNSCIVVGFIDAGGTKILSAGKVDNGTDNRPDGDTEFFIGSVSKTFTALLLQTMADRGEVKLDDPVGKYLPEAVRVPSFKGKAITLEDLGTQSSGLPFNASNLTGEDVQEQYETYTVEKMYEFLGSFSLSHEPGKEFGYSNVGMSLLGNALARKSGATFEALIKERVCGPLGMKDTCLHPSAEQAARVAVGHDKAGNRSMPWKLEAYEPAGAIHSTANDLLKYAAAQAGLAKSEISASIEKTHAIRHVDTKGMDNVLGSAFGQTAMCWIDRDAFQSPGMQLLAHAGGAGSYHAWVGFDVKQHRGVVVLSTDNEVAVENIGWTLLQHLPLNGESAKQFAREMVGIGVALDMNKQTHALSITKVFVDSSAAGAGLTAGETIRTIDGAALGGKSLADCAKLLRGEAGTTVHLELLALDGSINTVEVTRRKFVTMQ